MTDIKSMQLFFIDNQGSWPSDKDGTSKAALAGNLVYWPDRGQYPTFQPVAMATHPSFDGKIVVMAGNRRVVITMVHGAADGDDVKKAMSKMGPDVDQYCIAVDALVHALVLDLSQGERTSEVDPLSLLSWMGSTEKGQVMAVLLMKALAALLANPQALKEATEVLQHKDPSADAFMLADAAVSSIGQSIATRSAQAAGGAAPVKRRA